MNEIQFRKYLIDNNVNKKVISDHISRLKRIERSIEGLDLDEEYQKDNCSKIIKLFEKNVDIEPLGFVIIGDLPFGNYSMNTFKHSIKKYVEFKKKKRVL